MIVIIGHGPSILSGLGAVIDTGTVIRLKNGRAGKAEHWGTRTDYICGRFLSHAKPSCHFWFFGDETEERWLEYYRQFSEQKPSHGLCAAFMAKDELQPSELHFIGCDSMLEPSIPYRKWNTNDWTNPHDWYAENEALKSLGIKITDLRNI